MSPEEIMRAHGLDPRTTTDHQIAALGRFLRAKAAAEIAEAEFLESLNPPRARPRLVGVQS